MIDMAKEKNNGRLEIVHWMAFSVGFEIEEELYLKYILELIYV